MIKFPLYFIFFLHLIFSPLPSNSQSLDFTQQSAKILEATRSSLERFSVNKIIPDEIEEVTLLALSHFPELLDVKIDFQFQNKIRGSVMQAQPKVGSLLFDSKDNRSYRIKISRYLELLDEKLPIEDLPEEVLLGWLGHELGHIMDYLDRSAVNLVAFGIRYISSNNFVTRAEVAADSHSVAKGLGAALVATKDFVLNHDKLPEGYKDKIRALYLSPGEILSMVDVEDEEEED
ncbi:MAG TPA: hypothetical protein VKZ51_08615 [Cyclobacteriaceae bacterium]|nr:hypothetical protein [Cyclobacteriaceae bacterium]